MCEIASRIWKQMRSGCDDYPRTMYAALAPHEIVLRSTPSAKHRSLLASYLLNLKRGPESVRDMMVSDLRCWLDLGAVQQAPDLLIVLRQYLSDCPEARLVRHSGGQIG